MNDLMNDPSAHIRDLDHGVTTIDTGFARTQMAASHLVVDDGRAAFIDVGTSLNADRLLGVLAHKGIDREAVDYVMVTHVHLDHAGGAGVLMRSLPNAKLIVHPRGARHMADPTKLIAGATAVYGEEEMAKSYGEIAGTDTSRIVEAPEGTEMMLGSRNLRFIDTPGHAKHHYCVVDEKAEGTFTGDSFGLSYRDFDNDNGPWIFPTTTPIQFDPDAMHSTLDRIVELGLPYAYLTHYSRVTDLPTLAARLHKMTDDVVAIAREHEKAGDARHKLITDGLTAYYLTSLRDHGCDMADEAIREVLWIDIEVNAQGLEFWMDYAR